MKRTKYLLALLLAFLCALPYPLRAQTEQDALYIYRNDGVFNAFFYADIDRIEYSKVDTMGVEHDEYVTQEVYAMDSVFRIPISAIDSVGFVTPRTKYKSDVAVNDNSELWDYVVASDSATWFALSPLTPSYLVPRVGDKLVATRSREFLPQGCYGRVTNVTHDGQLTVEYETLDFTELFDEWVCKVAAESSDGSNPAQVRRRAGENSTVMDIPLPSITRNIDLSNISYSINDNLSIQGSGLLDVGVVQKLSVRAFLMLRSTLGINFDLIQRLETDRWFTLNVKGGIQGQLDIPLSKTYFLIPDTPFAIETQAGLSLSATGEVELGLERRQVTSLFSSVQYNNNFYDYDPTDDAGRAIGSVHNVFSKSENTFKGTLTLTAGPYYGVWFSVLKKEIVKVGMRYDAGLKAEFSLDFKASDILFTTLPSILPAYMLLSSTGLYNILNRDGSIKIGPFCTGKLEAGVARWKKEVPFLDISTKLAGFEGGLVPKFEGLDMHYDPDTQEPVVSTSISRRTLTKMPVGFVAYYKNSGKLHSQKWLSKEYDGNPKGVNVFSDYTLTLPKFGGGKTVRVFPAIRVELPTGNVIGSTVGTTKYDMLCSQYGDYTTPIEIKPDPEELTLAAQAVKKAITFTDNLDRNEDTYSRTVEVLCDKESEDEKDWIIGYWNNGVCYCDIEANTTNSTRTAKLKFRTYNDDQSVYEETIVPVTQYAPDTEDVSVEPTELEYEAAGGTQRVKVNWGPYNRYGATVRAEGVSWVTVAAADGYISITTKPNTSAEPRECYVDCRVYMAGAPESEWIKMPVLVKQKGAEVSVEPTQLEYEATGGSQRVKVNWGPYNYYGATVRKEGTGWVTVATDNGYIKVTVTENTSSEARQCYVDCYVCMSGAPENERVKMPVLVKQKGKAGGGEEEIIPDPSNSPFKSITFWLSSRVSMEDEGTLYETEGNLAFNFKDDNSVFTKDASGNITHVTARGHQYNGDLTGNNNATLTFDIDHSSKMVKNLKFTFSGVTKNSLIIPGLETIVVSNTSTRETTLGDFPLSTFTSTYKEGKVSVGQGLVVRSFHSQTHTHGDYSDGSDIDYTTVHNYLDSPDNYVWLIINEKPVEASLEWPSEAVMNGLKNAGMPIYEGSTPPTIDGVFSLAPVSVVADRIGGGAEMAALDAYIFRLSGQSGGKLKFSDYFIFDGEPQPTNHDDTPALIVGSGQHFTICTPSEDGYTNILSGELDTDGNIRNCHYAVTSATETGQFIILKDSDTTRTTFWGPGSISYDEVRPFNISTDSSIAE